MKKILLFLFLGSIVMADTPPPKVTVSTTNGLSILGQQISLRAGDSTHNGAITSTDWNTFNGKQSSLSSLPSACSSGDFATAISATGSLTCATPSGGGSVSSVFTRTGAVTAQSGDYTTAQVTESGNLYFTNARAQGAVSATAPIVDTAGVFSCNVASGSQPGCLAAADFTSFSGKQAAGNYITALTGDVAASGPGSVAATLATVNSNVGTFGSASSVGAFTVNGKGLITAGSSTAILIGESQVTNLVSDLAAKQSSSLTTNHILVGSAGGVATDVAMSGDATIAASGATTLATVNSNVGTFGSAAAVGAFTVNGKGLITAGASTAIQIAESQVTNLVSDLAGKQATGNYLTAITGDLSASGPGSATGTLATVNSNVGSFGSSTSIPSITVNGKGLVTAASGNAVIAPAGTLTGSTLASGVTASSLTSVGTIATGVWNGTTVDRAHGGTGLATATTDGQLLIGNSSTSNYTLSTLTAGSGISVTNGNGSITIAASGSGTVTSVGLTAPSILSVSGSPVTTSGTLALSLASQNANLVFAGPTSGGSTAPSFRSLVTADLPSNQIIRVISFTIDGGGAPFGTGSKGYVIVPYAGTITNVTMLADQTGSAVLDIKKSSYSGFPSTTSIVASAPPTISSAQKSQDTTLTGWTTSVSAGDILEFSVTSNSSITRLVVGLKVTAQ